MNTNTIPGVHHGRNIKRLRDILGVKQEAIAVELDMTQQSVSKLEQREQIEDEVLDKIAGVLGVPADAIKNYNEEATISFVANTFNDHASASGNASNANYYCTFNPIDKIVELYERMLKAEQEKVTLLQKIVDQKG